MFTSFYQVCWLFFIFSFAGWLGEVLFTAIRSRRYRDRGIVSGPLCIIYGFAGLFLEFTLRDLAGGWWFLFIGSALYATVIEWVAGHTLEHFTQTRWWDYSAHRLNLDGYICLSASLTWGALGLVVIKWVTPLLLRLYTALPTGVVHIALWVIGIVFLLDLSGTLLTFSGLLHTFPAAELVHNRLAALTLRAGMWILGTIEQRLQFKVPTINLQHTKAPKPETFAAGCSMYKIALLFTCGALLGDLTEMVFCRLTAGVWMSRSSLVWGPFSIVWGLALALVTRLLYIYKDRPAPFMFVAGTLLGGAYEYLCSVFTERVFGKVFWDYSSQPLNLAGRINLIYCFFWGFAAVAWFKVVFPPIERLIERIPPRPGKVVTWAITLFMALDILVSSAALIRYDARAKGEPAQGTVAVWLDTHYDDTTMRRIYPNGKSPDLVGTKVEPVPLRGN